MSTEASYWEDVVGIFDKTDLPTEIVSPALREADHIRNICAQDAFPTKMKAKLVIDLWLNTVFAHGGLDGRKKARTRRGDFEAATVTYKHAPFEYAFRASVKSIGNHLMNISRLAARPALESYRTAHNLTPSFRIGAAFGIRRRERTQEGHLIVRQGSSEFFTEETLEERFTRVLARDAHRTLKWVLNPLDATKAELLRAVLRATSLSELLSLLDGEFRIVPMASDELVERPGLRASTGLMGRRVNIYLDNVVETHEAGAAALRQMLSIFKKELLHD